MDNRIHLTKEEKQDQALIKKMALEEWHKGQFHLGYGRVHISNYYKDLLGEERYKKMFKLKEK